MKKVLSLMNSLILVIPFSLFAGSNMMFEQSSLTFLTESHFEAGIVVNGTNGG